MLSDGDDVLKVVSISGDFTTRSIYRLMRRLSLLTLFSSLNNRLIFNSFYNFIVTFSIFLYPNPDLITFPKSDV